MKAIPRNTEDTIIRWGGYSNLPIVGNGQLTDASNLTSTNFPCISPRPPREEISTLTNGQTIFDSNGVIALVDGTDFKYGGTTKGTVTASQKSMVEYIMYNSGADRYEKIIFIFPDKKYYNITTAVFGTVGTGTYPAVGSCPDIDFACIHANRIFGVKGNFIYASKYNDPFTWTTFDGTNTASWSVDTSESSSFSGIFSYQGHVTMFKNDVLYELFGDNPNNFRVKKVANKGCIDWKSICEVNGLLYFLSRDGFNTYGGGLPVPISMELNMAYTTAVCGTDGRKYYACVPNGSSYDLYVFDSLLKTWHKEDNKNIKSFAMIGGYLYCIGDNKVLKCNSGTETISWRAITEKFVGDVSARKLVKDLSTRIELSVSSTVSIYIKHDNGDWTLVKTISTVNGNVYTIPITPKLCDFFQLKFEGTGQSKIYELYKTVATSKRGG